MKRTMISAFAIAASACIAAPASAQQVHFAATTKGCFGSGCLPASGTVLDPAGLSYASGGFDQFTDPTGTLFIGGGANDNLGKFALTLAPDTYTGDIFNLLVTFTLPGTTNNLYTAMLTGIVTSVPPGGGVLIDFDNTPVALTASNGQQFTLAVSDVRITGGNENVGVQGEVHLLPEPATWAMMLLGFGGIGMAMRRKRRPALAQVA